MRILLFGAGGFIGRAIAAEAARRGHALTIALRDPTRRPDLAAWGRLVTADATDPAAVAALAEQADVVVSAIGPGPDHKPEDAAVIAHATKAIAEGMVRAGKRRLLVVGGAGTLRLPDGTERLDAPGYPEAYRPMGLSHRATLAFLRETALDWTYLSPPPVIREGPARGLYRQGFDEVLTDAEGHSAISTADYAIAMLDEAEACRFPARRITVAW